MILETRAGRDERKELRGWGKLDYNPKWINR